MIEGGQKAGERSAKQKRPLKPTDKALRFIVKHAVGSRRRRESFKAGIGLMISRLKAQRSITVAGAALDSLIYEFDQSSRLPQLLNSQSPSTFNNGGETKV